MSTASTAFSAANATTTEESSEDDDDDDLFNYTPPMRASSATASTVISGSAKSDEAEELASVMAMALQSIILREVALIIYNIQFANC